MGPPLRIDPKTLRTTSGRSSKRALKESKYSSRPLKVDYQNSIRYKRLMPYCVAGTLSVGILPLVIPLFVIQFITTQVKVWYALNHLPVTQIKMV